jgi:hypothetical protein
MEQERVEVATEEIEAFYERLQTIITGHPAIKRKHWMWGLFGIHK